MIVVVGIGADGMPGLAATSQRELRRATVIYGSRRQLDLLDDTVRAPRREWPSPMLPALRRLLDEHADDVRLAHAVRCELHFDTYRRPVRSRQAVRSVEPDGSSVRRSRRHVRARQDQLQQISHGVGRVGLFLCRGFGLRSLVGQQSLQRRLWNRDSRVGAAKGSVSAN